MLLRDGMYECIILEENDKSIGLQCSGFNKNFIQ